MVKEKVSVSIDENQIQWIDAGISKKRFASRSHAIEYALQRLIESENHPGRSGINEKGKKQKADET